MMSFIDKKISEGESVATIPWSIKNYNILKQDADTGMHWARSIMERAIG
jgi:hypothetical protein